MAPIPFIHRPLTERDLLGVVADLCRFTLREILNRRGRFFDPDSDLATDDKFSSLASWEAYHPPS
jgi:hypothetical protein